MSKILLIAGKAQSGKTSLANFVTGYQLKTNNKIKFFEITDDGRLLVNVQNIQADGSETEGVGELDIQRKDYEFLRWAETGLFPYAKLYNFGNLLKQVCMAVFDLSYEQVFGSNEEKNTPTKIKWKDFPVSIAKISDEEYMTGRQVMQYFGSEVCRKMYPDCWVSACYREIQAENYPLAIVGDGRYPNELGFLKDRGAKLVRLKRNPLNSDHMSETALDHLPDDYFDLVVPEDVTIQQKNELMVEKLVEWGWNGGLA